MKRNLIVGVTLSAFLFLAVVWTNFRDKKGEVLPNESPPESFKISDHQVTLRQGEKLADMSISDLRKIAESLSENFRETDPRAAVILDPNSGTIEVAREAEKIRYLVGEGETIVTKGKEITEGTFLFSGLTAHKSADGIQISIRQESIGISGTYRIISEKEILLKSNDIYSLTNLFENERGEVESATLSLSAINLEDGRIEVAAHQ